MRKIAPKKVDITVNCTSQKKGKESFSLNFGEVDAYFSEETFMIKKKL
jgi:hypothetical protein